MSSNRKTPKAAPSSNRLLGRYVWVNVLLIALVAVAYRAGWLSAVIPNDKLTLVCIGLIVLHLIYVLVRHGLKYARLIDRERSAIAQLQEYLESGKGSEHERIAGLFRGDAFESASQDTATAQFVRSLANAKRINPRQPVEQANFSALMDSDLRLRVQTLLHEGNMQNKYGLIGTFLGIAIGMNIDAGSLGNMEDAAILAMIGQVIVGIGVAILTTLVGTLGNARLVTVHKSFDDSITLLINQLERLMLEHVVPLVNDPAHMSKIHTLVVSPPQEV